MTRFLTLVAALACSAMPLFAQTYPTPRDTAVNDYADMIPPETEARIEARLRQLETDKGVEIAVVTLSSVRFYANDTPVDAYATGLFNTWGVGDADKGNGILFLIFRDDRELRIELGQGYGPGDQDTLTGIVGGTIMPAFMDGKFPDGIEAGVDGLITRIAAPVAAADPAETPAETPAGAPAVGGGTALYWIGGIIAGLVALIFGANKRRAAKLAATPCPACGKTGTLKESNVTLTEATETREGAGEHRTTCSACGHTDAKPYSISRRAPEKPAAPFKGGQSKGDGASGKW